MAAPVLTLTSQATCPHGGHVIFTTSNTHLMVGGAPALLETDIHQVAGCAFTLPGPKPSPCLTVRWSAGSPSLKVGGVPVLIQTSVGLCNSPEGAPQGPAIIASAQTQVLG